MSSQWKPRGIIAYAILAFVIKGNDIIMANPECDQKINKHENSHGNNVHIYFLLGHWEHQLHVHGIVFHLSSLCYYVLF